MPTYKIKLFNARRRCPKVPPDGSSLEEQMNTFMASMPMSAIADIKTTEQWIDSSMKYYGRIVYQE